MEEGKKMLIDYRPAGVCARQMRIEVEDGTVQSLEAIGGCHGNLQGIAKLVEGLPVDEVIAKLAGIRCGMKKTSCPDQIAKALAQYRAKNP